MLKGIDVSHHQGDIDWAKVKASGDVSFAILRCGISANNSKGFYTYTNSDTMFEANYKGCKDNGIPVGAYYYSKALTVEQAEIEAQHVISLLDGKQLEYPIYYDFEWMGEKADKNVSDAVRNGQFGLTKAECSDIIRKFCNTLEAAGYWAGIYASDTWFYSHFEKSLHTRYAVWSAKVKDAAGNPATTPPKYATQYQMWQYSWVGKIPGINVNVDTNYCYADYPTAIKGNRKNGYTEADNVPVPVPAAPLKTYTITAAKSGVTEDKLSELTTGLQSQGFMVTTKEE
jgi:lysozyme